MEPIYNIDYNDTSNESKLDRRQLGSTPNKVSAKPFTFEYKPIVAAPEKSTRNTTREDYDFSKYIVNRNNTARGPPKKVPSTTRRSTTKRPFIPNTTFQIARKPAPFSMPSTQRITTQRRPITTTTAFVPSTTRTTTTTTPRPTTQRTQRPTVRLNIPTTTTTTPQPPPSSTTRIPNTFFASPLLSNSIQAPSLQILPPFEELIRHDEVTLGPPIYYEWKAQMPSLDILPPFLDSELKDDTLTAHSQTTRSISSANNENSLESALKNLMKTNYAELQDKFSIPNFDFPLESEVERTGYENSNALNSFQLKIPRDVAKIEWYGENSACPECHPAFVKPGSCEPCVRIKQQ